MLVEQEIFKWAKSIENAPKILSLRLADVIGPWDDSCRFWKYVIWSKIAKITENSPNCEKYKIQLNTTDHINQKLSFTFSQDVISVIMKVIIENQNF